MLHSLQNEPIEYPDSTLDSFEHFAEDYDYLDFNSKERKYSPLRILLLSLQITTRAFWNFSVHSVRPKNERNNFKKYFESLPLVSLQEAVNTALTKLSEEGGAQVFRKFLESCIQARVKQYGTWNEEPDFDLQWYALEGMVN